METEQIGEAWTKLSKLYEASPDQARATYAPATATLDSGLKCKVEGPAGQVVETDMPISMGGGGTSPNPGWFFRASLAACCATMIAAQAARSRIILTHLEVTVTGEGDYRGMLGVDPDISPGHAVLRMKVSIGSKNANAQELEQLVRWADDHAPVGSTVRGSPEISLTVIVTENPAPAAAG
jgi:uncharacterized OsmC-like protein